MEINFITIYSYMGRNRNKFKEEPVKINVLVEKELLKEYKMYCLKNDIIMSERIRDFIKNDLKENNK